MNSELFYHLKYTILINIFFKYIDMCNQRWAMKVTLRVEIKRTTISYCLLAIQLKSSFFFIKERLIISFEKKLSKLKWSKHHRSVISKIHFLFCFFPIDFSQNLNWYHFSLKFLICIPFKKIYHGLLSSVTTQNVQSLLTGSNLFTNNLIATGFQTARWLQRAWTIFILRRSRLKTTECLIRFRSYHKQY